eukprot:359765-Chlamydomonas_euryale.AAC.3
MPADIEKGIWEGNCMGEGTWHGASGRARSPGAQWKACGQKNGLDSVCGWGLRQFFVARVHDLFT